MYIYERMNNILAENLALNYDISEDFSSKDNDNNTISDNYFNLDNKFNNSKKYILKNNKIKKDIKESLIFFFYFFYYFSAFYYYKHIKIFILILSLFTSIIIYFSHFSLKNFLVIFTPKFRGRE